MEDQRQKEYKSLEDDITNILVFAQNSNTSISKRVDEFEGKTETKFVLADV
jgi:hypothetical protein